ncbi:peptidoglycan recognition protein family protein [Pectinatus sottacetonis]|uniref:peptidoglycan recognition protein family protein n=1 Tax=Pectinatus sottacetonis TaxID=1002795 RepID=UPI0018C5FA0B|nr:peptidoglycan recognition family protein [Pectinatus sottacetonis]
MNRRQFIYYALSSLTGLLIASNSHFTAKAFASSSHMVSSPYVKETYLKFVMPLENRTETNMIILHHIGDTNRDVSAAEIHQWHLARGWAGIGYHYVIRKDGTIERGRPRDTIGAHCYGHNETSVGINIVGDFERFFPTQPQLASAIQLTAFLCQFYRLSPSDNIIFGHKDFNQTLCPGKNFYAQLDDFRQNVFKLL